MSAALTKDEDREDVPDEIVDGLREPLGKQSSRSLFLANALLRHFWVAPETRARGEALIGMPFQLRRESRLVRRPSLAYVLYDRWPTRVVPQTEAWEVIPALAVEVINSTDTVTKIRRKIHDYFAHGVALGWVIYPDERVIDVYSGRKEVRILDEADVLDGGEVIPGFRLAVRDLFAWLEPQPVMP